jgi:hypothetical protein
MRSSPSFSAVNRRGLGFHCTIERYGDPLGSYALRKSDESHVDDEPTIPLRKASGRIKNRRILIYTLVAIAQGIVIVATQTLDVVQYLVNG